MKREETTETISPQSAQRATEKSKQGFLCEPLCPLWFNLFVPVRHKLGLETP